MSESPNVPHPGSPQMPRWNVGALPAPPVFTARSWALLLGPGLVMGGAAIGGGEWLLGPVVAARYGGALLWLTTLSILGQVVYNLEISRYTLYTGEPIFVGKFRTLPGPRFWLMAYVLLDFGSMFPYLAANAATPLAAVALGRVPSATGSVVILGQTWTDLELLQVLRYMCFLLAVVPLVVGGKVYNSLKAVMSFKIVVVLGFLMSLAIFESTADTWKEIGTGFLKLGTVPIQRSEDLNGNGRLDAGEDWDGDGRLDRIEQSLPPTIDSNGDGRPESWSDRDGDGVPDRFVDVDGDGIRDGDNVDNVFVAAVEGRGMPSIEWSLIGFLAALAAIAGSGGLTNTTISAYTRDQGWGMGQLVGAVPSVVGGRRLKLSHVGTVFPITPDAVSRFRGWYRHVLRDQLVVWLPACFLGVALPSMLSVQFLPRGTEATSWSAAAMTADAVAAAVTPSLGPLCWFMTLFCGFLVLAPSAATTADGFLRRWVDVFWTGSARLRKLDPHKIRHVYFAVLCGYTLFGLCSLTLAPPAKLIVWATTIYNYALGVSCWHTVAVNVTLLPPELRPRWRTRIALVCTGLYFTALAVITTLDNVGLL
ncbi:MAG: Nramp family divalent metal transporter [Vicinamibacteraceae bacterium]